MRIKTIKATLLRERVLWAREVETTVNMRSSVKQKRRAPAGRSSWPGSVLVEIETDNGAAGVGLGGGGQPGALIIENYLSPLLVGQNPLDIGHLWELLYRATFRYGQAGIVLMAMSAIDLALWDLKGKATGQPVWQLLGGKVHERIPVYATVRDAAWAQTQGFYGIKLGGPYGPRDGSEGMRKNEERVAAVREQVGTEFRIMIDCARTWDVEYTIQMARILTPYHIWFIEEPIISTDVDGYARLRRSIDSIMIACGEHVYTHYGARELLERGAVDIIQPDIRWTGGLSETLRICDLAARHNIPVIPHRGGMAWPLHLIAARPECTLAEGLALTQQEAACSVFTGEPFPENGYLTVSDAPGFGLTLQSDRIEQFRESPP